MNAWHLVHQNLRTLYFIISSALVKGIFPAFWVMAQWPSGSQMLAVAYVVQAGQSKRAMGLLIVYSETPALGFDTEQHGLGEL